MKRVGPGIQWQHVVTIVVTACITFAAASYWTRRDPRATLIDAAGSLEYRAMQARVIGFPYRPLHVTRGGEKRAATLPMLEAAAAVATRGAAIGAGARVHAEGVTQLLFEEWDGAVQTLHNALRAETQQSTVATAIATSRNAALLNDVAAAHHSRARYRGRPYDYVIAAEAAARAWTIEQTAETAWNRALTIEALSMRDAAAAAWRDYLRLDATSPWVAEVREHLDDLDEPTQAHQWNDVLPLLERAALRGDRKMVADLIARFPDHARREAERKYLPRAVASDSKSLTLCRAVGRALRDATGESLLYDTVAHIDAAGAGDAALTEGFRLYAKGLEARASYRIADAGPLFLRASEKLRAAGSPFADAALLLFWNCERYTNDRRVIDATAAWLAQPPERYPALVAQVRWTRGLSLGRAGYPQAATEEYTRALELFTRLRETDNVTAMHEMLSEIYEFVGDAEGAWKHRFAALERFGAAGTSDPTLLELLRLSAAAALKEGFPSVAILLLDREAAATNTPALLDVHVPTLLARSRAHRALGNVAAAAADLREARAAVDRIPDAAVAAETSNHVDIVLDRLTSTRDAGARLRILDESIAFARDHELGFRVASFELQQGLEYLRMKRFAEAERSLFASAEEFERQRAAIVDEDQRSAFLAARQDVYRYLAALLSERGEVARALDVVERSRARTLFEQVTQEARPALLPVRRIQELIPRDTALVVFGAVAERLGVWIVSSREVRYVPLDVAPSVVERDVACFRGLLRTGDRRRTLDLARDLHQSLVQPWYAYARRFQRLVFIADAPIAAVPFAALQDGATGEFLIQRHVVSTSPSANVYAARRRRSKAPVSALVVAPATSVSGAGREELLAASRKESNEVAQHYASPFLLQGAAATREEFLARASSARIIHFAGHAVSVDAAVPYLVFANDRSVYAEDISHLRLDATRVVVLAACDSGSDFGSRGGQGISSLARAFLAAGVPDVVASYWPVDDARAARLSRRLHTFLSRGDDPADALRNAQLQSLTSSDARSRDVSSWAPFVVIHQRSTEAEERN